MPSALEAIDPRESILQRDAAWCGPLFGVVHLSATQLDVTLHRTTETHYLFWQKRTIEAIFQAEEERPRRLAAETPRLRNKGGSQNLQVLSPSSVYGRPSA